MKKRLHCFLCRGVFALSVFFIHSEKSVAQHLLFGGDQIKLEAGLNFGNVVKTNIYLSDMSLFAAVNDVYGEYFTVDMPGSETAYPARETVAVKTLPKNVNVEISMIASS